MLRKLLVGTDFSPPANRAVHAAAAWARREKAALRIVHVAPPRRWLAGAWGTRRAVVDAVHRHASEALRKLADAVDPARELEISTGLLVGAASAALRHAAEDFHPDVLVAGARGEHASGAREVSLGATALKLLATSPVPLMLVRRGANAAPASVLAAVDLSVHSAEVLAWAARCVAPDGRLYAFHAWEAPFASRLEAYGLARDAIGIYGQDEQRRRETELATFTAQAGERLTQSLVAQGDPVARLFERLQDLEPELLVVGRHDPRRRRRRRSEPYTGSVSRHAALFAPCDVLIVAPQGAGPAAPEI